jgi:hypothetical protein
MQWTEQNMADKASSVPDDSRGLNVCFERLSQRSLLLISMYGENLDSPGMVSAAGLSTQMGRWDNSPVPTPSHAQRQVEYNGENLQ